MILIIILNLFKIDEMRGVEVFSCETYSLYDEHVNTDGNEAVRDF